MNLSLSGGSLYVPRPRMKRLPTTILTPEDWIADVVETRPSGKRNRYRVGVSPHLSESQAQDAVNRVLRWRGATMADITMWRRKDAPAALPGAIELSESVQRGSRWRS